MEDKKQKGSEEHLKHVRTVNFTLWLLCFGLLSSFILSREGEVKQALKQLRSVNNVVENWKANWLDLYATELACKDIRPNLSGSRWISASDGRPPFQVELEMCPISLGRVPDDKNKEDASSRPGLAPRPLWEFLGAYEQNDKRLLDIRRPNNLAEFEKLWNTLEIKVPIYRARTLHSKAFVYQAELGEQIKEIKIVDIATAHISDSRLCRAQLAFSAFEDIEFNYYAKDMNLNEEFGYVYFGGCRPATNDSRWNIGIPAKGEQVGEFGGQISFNKINNLNWDLGPFSRTFPQLNKVTQNFRDLSFDRLFKILESEAERSDDRVEIFGAKFPTHEIARWGLPVLLLVQLYLLLNLDALKFRIRPEDARADVPWIGIYQSMPARIGMIASTFVFPTLVLAFLGIHQARLVGGKLAWSVVIVGIILSALFAIVSFRSVREILKATCPSD